MGLRPGEAMDLLTGWDFTLKRHREAAMAYMKRVKPNLLIGSPECTMCSALQAISKKAWNSYRDERLVEAKQHIDFVISLYEGQIRGGRWFLHEHSASASSWDLDGTRGLAIRTGVVIQIADQCMCGLRTWSGNINKKTALARKGMTFMTNCTELAED